jgi:hypothetical protein
MDTDPGADGHLLVIPNRHSADLLEISPDDLTATMFTAQRIGRTLQPALGADGVILLARLQRIVPIVIGIESHEDIARSAFEYSRHVGQHPVPTREQG